MLAMQRTIVAEFNATDWHELGYLTGFHDYIQGHLRLLRSLGFGDDDYGACVFQALQHFANHDPRALVAVIEHQRIHLHLQLVQADKLIELGYQVGTVPAVLPSASASDVVRRALTDADNLLATLGAPSAIDRRHAAMQGYGRTASIYNLLSQAGRFGLSAEAARGQIDRLVNVVRHWRYSFFFERRPDA